jgi:hypothetical protein
MEGRWPTSPEGFEAASRAMAAGCNALAGRILTLLEARACPHLPLGTLAAAHTVGRRAPCTRPLKVPPLCRRTGPHSMC